MKTFKFLYILILTCCCLTVNGQIKQEDPKKAKQEELKKVKPEDLKKTKEDLQKVKEELSKVKEDLKKIKPTDSIKKLKVAVEEIDNDSIIVYKGKFKPYKKKAHASYYHDKFNGKRTASGRKYDKNKYTAAHKKLPFGTKVRVTNESNGKSVVVEVTDRGPFTKGREIDLSRKAFMAISGGSGSGSISATIEVLQE